MASTVNGYAAIEILKKSLKMFLGSIIGQNGISQCVFHNQA
jgi:hypothetical protein